MNNAPRVLLHPGQLHQRAVELGKQITHDYTGKDLHLVCVLKGAVMFLADLMRQMDIPLTLDFLAVSSYGAATETSGVVRILKDLDTPIEGRNVLVVEDIIDTGLTLDYLMRTLDERSPRNLRACVLLDKKEHHEVEVPLDYIGFEIENVFVVGYGIDFNEKYRYLPYVGVLNANSN